MTEQGAERAIITSALTVAGIYAYRRATETPGPAGGSLGRALFSDFGRSAPVPVATFVTAWGFTFLVISLVGTAAPGLGGAFALLVATADALGNFGQLANDVNAKVGTPPPSSSSSGRVPPAATTGQRGR